MSHAQCKLADNGKPNVCNNWTGSKLLINLKHPVVERFKASLQAQGHALGRTLCEGSSSSRRSQNDEFSDLSQVRPIGEFRNLMQNAFCITVGTTTKFNPNQFGWYYESCTKCPKSSKSNVGSYRCSCGEDVDVPLTRYKVVVQVAYDGDKADFVFWDKECVRILGVTADALRKSMQEVDEDDPMIYPKHLDNLLGLELALRVKYQPYYHQSSVQGFSSDPAVIRKIKQHLHPDGMQSDAQQVDENIVHNNPTGSFEHEKISGTAECSKTASIPVNTVCDNPAVSVKVEQLASSAECLKPISVCMDSVPVSGENVPDQIARYGAAKRSFSGKYKGTVASNDCDPIQPSSNKLAKCIKKE